MPESPVRIVGVVTQPDKPVGRRQTLTAPAVKVLAQTHDLPVLQPVSLRRPAVLEALRRLKPDVGIVAAFGKILRPDVLSIPPHGYLNVHSSLLPRWRGAWPVGAAIQAGDVETGVTIMQLDEGMDTGPLLANRRTPILMDDTTDGLEQRLALLGAELLIETLPGHIAGTVPSRPQSDSEATYCRPISKSDGQIDWRQPARQIDRHVRAMFSWPGAFTRWDGKQLSIRQVRVLLDSEGSAPGISTVEQAGITELTSTIETAAPGTVVALGRGAGVITGDGLLSLEDLQLEGKQPSPARAFVNGYRTFVGSVLG